jgi:hypothetical protein
MSFNLPFRAVLLAAALAAPALPQGIPPTAPTQPAAAQTLAVSVSSQTPANQPPRRAQVDFTTGLLSVNADNSSLNQILRDVTRLTGMKITGGVNDERVFGTYGPGDASTVLSTLLRGTGSNVLIIFDARQQPQELVLTPRGGGPTPPNPNASRGRDEEDLPPQRTQRMQRMEQNGFNNRPPQPPQPVPQPPVLPAPPADTTVQPSPGGVSTPEQIYQQLLKNQQQKQQQRPGANPTPPQ